MEYQVMANPLGKTRDTENPYAIFKLDNSAIGPIELRVLKTYKLPKNEADDRYARWYTAAKPSCISDATNGSWEFDDTYRTDVIGYYTLTYASPEFQEAYPNLMFSLMVGEVA